jgi:superfamily II DNA/RNA helicase
MPDDDDNMDQEKNDDLILGEDEVYGWQELRLHPLLVKAMRRLGFREPTPIQKSSYPAAAHQGKVCQYVLWRLLTSYLDNFLDQNWDFLLCYFF